MKKFYSLLLTIIAVFTLAGCGDSVGEKLAESIANSIFYSHDIIEIPDHNTTGISSPITVDSAIISITKMEVLVDINHTRVGDLRVYLKSPAGRVVKLSINRGGNGVNFNPVFIDTADKSIKDVRSGDEPFSSDYRPEEPLSNFNGENPNGVWNLIVYDDAAGEIGKIKEWYLFIFGNK